MTRRVWALYSGTSSPIFPRARRPTDGKTTICTGRCMAGEGGAPMARERGSAPCGTKARLESFDSKTSSEDYVPEPDDRVSCVILRMGSPPSGLSHLISEWQQPVDRQCYQPWVPMHMGVTLTDRRPPSGASTPQNHTKVEFAASPLASYAASTHAPSHHATGVYPDDHISATLPASRYKE